MTQEPDFDALAEGTAPEERHRLRRVHDQLVAAGPPPELPPALLTPLPERRERPAMLTTLPRPRLGALLTAAAGLVAAAFVAGYVIADNTGSSGGSAGNVFNLVMKPTAAAPQSAAVLGIPRDHAGSNIPLAVTVSGLKWLPEGGYYELWLTRVKKASGGGTTQKRVVSCGTFVASSDRLTVTLNAPYRLEESPGWVITRHEPGAKSDPVVLTT